MTNRRGVWNINHLYHHVVLTDCERQDKIFVIAGGVNCALGPSKSTRYSEDFVIAGFVIAGFVSIYFTVNSAGLSNVVRYNEVFVIAGYVIAGCRCLTLACISVAYF